MTLAEHLQAIIHAEVKACNGNVSEAARQLGVHRRTLQRWLHGVEPTGKISHGRKSMKRGRGTQ